MTSTIALRRGDVVLVPFDFTDRSGTKWRPAVVMSGDTYNRSTPDIVVASVTGNLNALPHPGDLLLADWQAAGLIRPSLARTKLTTIEARIVGRRLGSHSVRDLALFEDGLCDALSLG